MSPSAQFDLFAALGYAVLERTGEGTFRALGSAPRWLPDGDVTDAFPFLELFLQDAEEYWAYPGGRPRLSSDLWTQADDSGRELHFRAVAVAGVRNLLLIERVDSRFNQAQAFVQYAHEAKLAEEQIAKLSRELARATEAKSEFLARMSHEIRTPLNSLLGMAELLSETELTAEQREYVRIFQRAGGNLLNVINDILDFSKVEAGQIQLECIGFQLAEVVGEAIEIIAVRARAKGLEVHCAIQPGLAARWMGDPGRLRQILLNLLGNAVKFTERGAIRVSVEQLADELHFAVGDTGPGIPADRISTIFESFTQADASTTRKYGGTGLGLAISKRFVELMGGRIWADSTLGAGSTIHFTVRMTVGDANVPEAAEDAPAAELSKLALRILLADDSADNRFLIRGYLKATACVIDEVENGVDAVERFQQAVYDLILMDAEMPVMDGYAAVRAIREHENKRGAPATPVLALTAHAFEEARERSLAAGCTDHLTKPIAKAALLAAIARHAPEPRSEAPVPVIVEDWLKPVVPGYLEKRRHDVSALETALEQRDFATIQTLGHQMAGSGAGYGFAEITTIGAVLEESALTADNGRIRRAIGDLDRLLKNVVTR
ncbi:MAG TPA: ATP-binding protein [Bryobacteraceae bacterium]|nr:ATP-binding protein [Bryobacteraceae bacterium]HUO29655.1 ATP-binding protein [Bryobacteraceae bacterium]